MTKKLTIVTLVKKINMGKKVRELNFVF